MRVQTMTNTPTNDVSATLAQICAAASAGSELVRLAVPDEESAKALPALIAESPVPLVADIHYDPELALMSLEAGIAKLRLNPGTIQNKERIRDIVASAKERGVPIRVGANAGSLPRIMLLRYGGPTAEALAEAALSEARYLEELGFEAIVVSVKAFEVPKTVEASRLVAAQGDWPQHLGITEAGTISTGLVRSAAGLGILLAEGLGDTVRISLSGDPLREVDAAWQLLAALELRQRGPVIVSCPTCARVKLNVEALADRVREATREVTVPLRLAVMGCEVNGPGEAREADLGLCGSPAGYMLFSRGKVLRKFSDADPIEVFLEELRKLIESGEADNGAG